MSGEFDLSGRDSLRTALADAVEQHAPDPPRDLVVEMSGVTFVDAGTVGVLLDAWEAAASRQVRLRITGAYGIVQRVIRACGAWRQLTGADDDGLEGPGEADGRLLADDQVRLRDRLDVIDPDVRATRRAILHDLRDKLRNDHGADLRTVGGGGVALDAIILAATIVGGADACDLQVLDPRDGSLTIVRHRGFTDEFLTQFARVEAGQATSCSLAAATGEPVIIDDVEHDPLFAADPVGRAAILAAGSHAVHSHPLVDGDGRPIGVLSFHYNTVNPRRGQPELVAWWAARALSQPVSQ